MAPRPLQIQCVRKTEHVAPWTLVTQVGGVDEGLRWMMTVRQAALAHEAKAFLFFVSVGGERFALSARIDRFGDPYLVADRDGETSETLLSLPDCP